MVHLALMLKGTKWRSFCDKKGLSEAKGTILRKIERLPDVIAHLSQGIKLRKKGETTYHLKGTELRNFRGG